MDRQRLEAAGARIPQAAKTPSFAGSGQPRGGDGGWGQGMFRASVLCQVCTEHLCQALGPRSEEGEKTSAQGAKEPPGAPLKVIILGGML